MWGTEDEAPGMSAMGNMCFAETWWREKRAYLVLDRDGKLGPGLDLSSNFALGDVAELGY
jgi:hypothetical protein